MLLSEALLSHMGRVVRRGILFRLLGNTGLGRILIENGRLKN